VKEMTAEIAHLHQEMDSLTSEATVDGQTEEEPPRLRLVPPTTKRKAIKDRPGKERTTVVDLGRDMIATSALMAVDGNCLEIAVSLPVVAHRLAQK
jgi:hypothetical protein